MPCYFAAEMEPAPALKKRIPLFVTVSREKIEVAEHGAARTSAEPVAIAATRKIVVEVIARKNCRVVGDASGEIDVPEARRPETLRFMVEGDRPGEADILVEVRQGARILVSHALSPVFVDADGKKLGFNQVVSVAPDGPGEPAVLRIYEIVDGSRITLRFRPDMRRSEYFRLGIAHAAGGLFPRRLCDGDLQGDRRRLARHRAGSTTGSS